MRVYLARLFFNAGTPSHVALATIGAFAAAGFFVLVGLKFGQHIFMDCGEAYAWGQQFLGGYGRHPPLTGWIAGVWYKIFPAESWSSYALSRVMSAICLAGIYFVARRVLDHRRALFVVLIMFVHPLMLGFKSDRYNNYQVLQAIVPFVVLSFLVAWEKRTVVSGAVLGVIGALATMTIYLGVFAVAAVGIAALAHRDRMKFLTSKIPYVAIAFYILVLSPHLIWLWDNNFASIEFAHANAGVKSISELAPLGYLNAQLVLIAIPLIAGVIALWPLKFSMRRIAKANDDVFLLVVTVCAMVVVPVLVYFVLAANTSGEWGNPFFTLVPVAILAVMPRVMVSQRAVAGAAIIAICVVGVYGIIASFYPWINFRSRPDYRPFEPVQELSEKITQEWRSRTNTPLRIVVSDLEHASYITFYSSDHPHMIADFAPHQAPWLKFSEDIPRFGYVGVCAPSTPLCVERLRMVHPQVESAERIKVTAQRQFAGVTGPPLSWDIWIVRPQR